MFVLTAPYKHIVPTELIPILSNKVALEDLRGLVNVRGAMNCATTNAFLGNGKLSF